VVVIASEKGEPTRGGELGGRRHRSPGSTSAIGIGTPITPGLGDGHLGGLEPERGGRPVQDIASASGEALPRRSRRWRCPS